MAVKDVLAVDLGTTYCAAAVARDGRIEMVRLATSTTAVPSTLFLADDGTFLIGEPAERRALTDPDRVGRGVKRRIGDPAPVLLGGTPFSPERLMAELLTGVLREAESQLGDLPDTIVVTHPATWGEYKRAALQQVLDLAGVVGTLISEPEAAAIHYAHGRTMEIGSVVAVYDFGGGTFDVAVLRRRVDGFELLGEPQGVERLGGLDLDDAVVAFVDEQLGGALTEADPGDPGHAAAMARVRADAEAAKIALSSDTEASIAIALPGRHETVRLTRAEFEGRIRPLLTPTIGALTRAMGSAGLAPDDVERVLLVGGSSRTPLVGQLIADAVPCEVVVDADPKHAVALGAARWATAARAPAPATTRRTREAPGEARRGIRRRGLIAGGVLAALALTTIAIVVSGAGEGASDDEGADRTETSAQGGQAGFSDLVPGSSDLIRNSQLEKVLERGRVTCGVTTGSFEAFNTELCGVLAAGLFGDPEAVEVIPVVESLQDLQESDRATGPGGLRYFQDPVRAGADDLLSDYSVDVVFSSSTLATAATLTSATSSPLSAGFVTFHDDLGVVAAASLEAEDLDDLGASPVCALDSMLDPGTVLAEAGLSFRETSTLAVSGESGGSINDGAVSAFDAGQCSIAGPTSRLAAIFADDLASGTVELLPGTFGSGDRFLGARPGLDPIWSDAVTLLLSVPLQAEQLGITARSTLDGTAEASSSEAAFLLGDPDPGFGLPANYPALVLERFGSYAEIYERTLEGTVPRAGGPNRLVEDGGRLAVLPQGSPGDPAGDLSAASAPQSPVLQVIRCSVVPDDPDELFDRRFCEIAAAVLARQSLQPVETEISELGDADALAAVAAGEIDIAFGIAFNAQLEGQGRYSQPAVTRYADDDPSRPLGPIVASSFLASLLSEINADLVVGEQVGLDRASLAVASQSPVLADAVTSALDLDQQRLVGFDPVLAPFDPVTPMLGSTATIVLSQFGNRSEIWVDTLGRTPAGANLPVSEGGQVAASF